ncbi:hypothetical protein V1527DRAFT_476551 [Lipomyces starkeyi]
MDPLMDNAESSDRAFASPVFYLDTDDADYFAFHDLDLDSSANQSGNSASTTNVVDPFDEMMVDGSPVSMTHRHFLQPTVMSEQFGDNTSPSSSNTTPVLTHDEDDIEDEEDDDRYMAEHFDFDSATTPHNRLRGHREGLTAVPAGGSAVSGITIRSSDSDSSLSSVKRDTFSYPPSPKSLSSQHSTPFSMKSASQVPTSSKLVHPPQKQQPMRNGLPLSVRDITPPQHSPGHTPPPTSLANGDADDSIYQKPHDWVPPPMMPDFDPLDWIHDEAPYHLSVSTDTLKSRVETQIKALLTFVPAPTQLYMHLPATTIAKPRQQLRKTFTSDPKTLELDAIVVCDHNRYRYINVCPGCMNRERKRASRKKLPSVDDTHWLESQDNRGIMFNCAELMEISDANTPSTASDTFNSKAPEFNGDVKHVEIPMRIPCYCRHHSEKTGFRVYFVIKDHTGKVVARTFTEPIMITDDHKTTNANARRKTAARTAPSTQPASSANASDNSSESPTNEYGFAESANPRKRKMSPSIGRTQSTSVLSTTSVPQQQQSQPQRGLQNGSQARPRQHSTTSILAGSQPEPFYRAYDESNFNTRSHSVESFGFPAYSSSNPLQVHQQLQAQQMQQPAGLSPLSHASPVLSNASTPESTVSGTFSRRTSKYSTASAVASVQSPRERTSNAGLECPALQRLIPTEGPIRGGIEVTLLGTSFHQGLTVMFGDQPAVKTHIWNDSTIVAILPPAATPGPVVVRLRSISEISSDNLKLFTYIDDTDRQLMELALQVIGLKMTGRLEDARQIAMRIVSQTGSGGDNGSGQNNIMAATTASGSNGLEKTLLKCLDLVDYNESPHKVQWQLHNSAGQTMLHLAALLGFQRLVAALLARGASYRIKDSSGYTPLHFAAMRGYREIVLRLLNSGADPLARSVLGHTVVDLSCNDEVSALLTSFIAEPMDYGTHSRQHSEIMHRASSRQKVFTRQSSEFPDWPSSSGPSSPAASTSDEIEYSDSLDDDNPPDIGRSRLDEDQDDAPLSMEGLRRTRLTMNAVPAETKKAEKKSKPWSRKKLFGRSSQKPTSDVLDTKGSSKQKQLQLRLAEYLASLHEQTVNRMHPNWHAANHFMHDAFTSFSSFKPALANIANQQSRRANEIMQSAFENSWFSDYFSSTGAGGNKNDNSAPPSYEEIYPEASASSAFAHPSATSDGKDGAVRAATLQDEESKLREQEILLKFWQNKKKKQMRNDLMLFAFWLPVLCVILAWGAMSFFGIHVLDYIPIPQKLVEFVTDRQKLPIADPGGALKVGRDILGAQNRIVAVE